MNESEITSARDLNSALAGMSIRKRAKLWRTADGRSCLWLHIFFISAGSLLIFSSLSSYIFGFVSERDALIAIVFGLTFVGTASYQRQQSQINALRELLKLRWRDAGA